MKNLLLDQNWQCKQRSPAFAIEDDFTLAEHWFPAHAPGCVHLDLLAAERIPDPFLGLNEELVQWVGTSDWLYRCTFTLPADYEHADALTLCLDGLDTYATVWLNDTQVLRSDNMFVPHRVPVGALLRSGRNQISMLFESALRHGDLLEEQYGKRNVWNGANSRVYVRKAQYHYGWDWGPTLLTAGPWRAVRLEAYSARVADLHCPVVLSADLQQATFPVRVELETTAALDPSTLHLALYDPDGQLLDEATLPVAGDELHHTFTQTSPDLWWPRGYGEQPLYRLVATLLQGTKELDRREVRLGVRRVQLVQRPLLDEVGQSFFFEINNMPIFCGGANWIPADSFTTRVTPERYRAWLELAAAGNMIMLRVWGGGIYEEDIFYDLCDELGLLVWQDFMFACGSYPGSEEFQASVRAEAEANVRRLRHHPSLVLWCGNNEDYQLVNKVYNPAVEPDFADPDFPARVLYERLLPEVCVSLDGTRPYWPGSPCAGAFAGDSKVGDTHIWSVWHGLAAYQDYPKLAGRFVSEYGMASLAAVETMATVVAPDELYPQSRTMDGHQKAGSGNARIAFYLNDTVRYSFDLPAYTYATQLLQAEAVGAAVRGWRRRWQGEGREYTAGALVWQLDDCWPVTSWAIVDYVLRPKPAYYVMKRELASYTVGLAGSARERVAVWGTNSTRTDVLAELELRTWTLAGELVSEERRQVTLAPNQASEFGLYEAPQDTNQVVCARLLRDGVVVARTTLWPEPLKYLDLSDPAITLQRMDGDTVQVSSQRPAKGVWLAAGDGVKWGDNMLDLQPGDPQIISAPGLGDAEIAVRWLDQ